LIRCDNRLAQIFGYPQLHFSQLPELITQHLTRPDPIVIDYTIRADKAFHQSSKAYDVEVELDSAARQKMVNIVSSTQAQKEIMGLDDKIVQCVQSINNSKIKRDFLMQFSKEPVEFINKWIASQARDLEVILGESKVNLEEIRQTDFYKQPWMKEAVFHYLTTKVHMVIYIYIYIYMLLTIHNLDTTTYARTTWISIINHMFTYIYIYMYIILLR
jgi:SWI/SNF-related matrix-associated actin-dependent regulator of chromatin subfamily D